MSSNYYNSKEADKVSGNNKNSIVVGNNGSPDFLQSYKFGNGEEKVTNMTEKQEQQKDEPQQYPDPFEIMNDNDYVEIKRDEDGRLCISLFDHVVITKEFLKAMQKNGYEFDRVYNDIVTCSQHEDSHDTLDSTQEVPLASIKTTIRFEDTKYVPGLESCCQACGDHMVIKDQQESETENALNNEDYSNQASD